jgi:hypothetical protein
MRKATFAQALSPCISLFCLGVFSLAAQPTLAQNTPPAKDDQPVVMPSDPAALMSLALRANDLTDPDVRPWHIKVTWKLLDEAGNVMDQGTYEELFASETKFKQVLTGTSFKQTYYGTEKGHLRSGVNQLPSYQMENLRDEFVDPLPDPRSAAKLGFILKSGDVYGIQMNCLSPAKRASAKDATYTESLSDETYCLGANEPAA